MLYKASTIEDLEPIAKHLCLLAENHKVFTFSGPLGAGKTALIKALCSIMGAKDNVSSPTYGLVNEYNTLFGPVYHFDFYRLKSIDEAFDIGAEEYLYSGNICLVEWPEMAEGLIPHSRIHIEINPAGGSERFFTITKH